MARLIFDTSTAVVPVPTMTGVIPPGAFLPLAVPFVYTNTPGDLLYNIYMEYSLSAGPALILNQPILEVHTFAQDPGAPIFPPYPLGGLTNTLKATMVAQTTGALFGNVVEALPMAPHELVMLLENITVAQTLTVTRFDIHPYTFTS